MKYTHIYGIYNFKTRRWYVGQSVNPIVRFSQHMMIPEHMRDDLNKFGRNAFQLYILSKDVPLCYANECEYMWYQFFGAFSDMYNANPPSLHTKIRGSSPNDYSICEDPAWKIMFGTGFQEAPTICRVR